MIENRHVTMLFTVLQAMLVTMILSSLVSVMHAFMGGSQMNPDFLQLHAYQVFGIGLSVAVLLYSLVYFSKTGSPLAGLGTAWQHIPGWLIFGVVMLNSLALCGELSYLLLSGATELMTEWVNHVALLCLGASSIAFMFLYAVSHVYAGGKPFSKARWSPDL